MDLVGNFESPITHPWRKYCTKRWDFLARVLPLSACAIAILIVVLVLDSLMKVKKDATHSYAVSGYSALEQAKTLKRAREVLDSWSPKQRMTAAFSAGLHFLFLFLYPSVLALLCCWGGTGDFLAWLQLLGAIFDAFLQAICGYSVINGTRSGLPQTAFAMAIMHLAILAAAALFFVICRIGHWTIWKNISRAGPLDGLPLKD